MAGLFITFEGGDGSGKSTQVEHLAQSLRSDGHDVVTTREPGGTPGADAIRHVVLSGAARELGANMEAVLFSAARADHIAMVIRPALERGAIVICDRFLDSTRVYQSGRGESDDEFLDRLEVATIEGLLPDLTIILDVPVALGMERADARRKDSSADRFEADDLAVHAARRERFLAIADAEPDRCVVIDGNGDEREIAEDIRAALDDRLGLKIGLEPAENSEPIA